MTAPVAEWVEAPVPEAAAGLDVSELGLDPELDFFPAVLARRGVDSMDEARSFLEPRVDQLHDPFRLDGMDAAVDRLIAARDRSETVAIVGDYDVDGISATAMLVAVFGACRIETTPILPHRLRDGYGFQSAQVERAAVLGAGVIVTADCGSTSVEAAREALNRGIAVIVTDHHLPGVAHDPRVIEINPHLESSTYPFRDLSGAGVAFKLASALAERAGRPVAPDLLLRVACLGTIADMVPLRGENRVIARLGLESLGRSRAAGLTSLMEVAGVRLPLDASDVGFRLGPRINAAGRMDSAHVALDLLLERDPARAAELAARLDAWNTERRQAELRVVEETREWVEKLEELPPILVASSPEWHRGVVGIAAGRIARSYHRPTLLLAEQDGVATGSGRSVEGVHLHGFLSAWRERLARFGGHAQAVGLSVDAGALPDLRREWEEAAAVWDPALLRPRYQYEARLTAGQVNLELTAALTRLAPFGVGNREPLLRVGPLQPVAPPRFFGSDHLGLKTRGAGGTADGAELDLVGWRWRDRAAELAGTFEVVGYAEIDGYTRRPVLRIRAARPIG